MKKAIFIGFFLTLAISAFSLLAHPKGALAFNANNLIDDSIFTNSNSMNAAQIDSWLNSNFGSTSCISTMHGFTTQDVTGYSPGGGFTYGGNVSAGTVIFDASHVYGINPQVLLATLQKEQSLVSGNAGCSILRYTGAMGYGCPDGGSTYSYSGVNLYSINGATQTSVSGTCVNTAAKAGFSQQLIHAAWLLKFGQQRSKGNTSWNVQLNNFPYPGNAWDNSDDPQTCYGGPMTQGTYARCSSDPNPVFYDGYTTIDGQSTHMDSGATAALYWYTPHFAGNQNFVNIYTSWFGNTTGPDYAWSIDSFTYNNVMTVGQTQTVTLKATNTGRLPWYNQAAAPNTPTRLGTWQPGRASNFQAGSWLSPIRPVGLAENVVQPGSDGTFTFQLTAPMTTGSYVEGFNLLMENYLWLPWSGFSPTIQVVNPYQWSINSVTYGVGTGFMAPGTTQQITVKALNTGSATWTNSGGSPIKLGTWAPSRQSSVGSGWLSPIRAATLTEASVAPGQVGTFTFNVFMPDSGQHYERLNLVAEGIAWFNDPGLTLYLQGQTYAWQPLWYSPSTGNWTMPRGTSFILTIQAKNTGTATWYKNGPFPVRIGTDPPGRGSALFTQSWINSIRPAGLAQDSVPPGSEGTFTFNAVAPSVPGKRFEAFNLVAEGILWFNDPGFGFYITPT